ncbi:hypothetical protein F383_36740 [Gossypium arboreum]|uniref:Uncharacterized protein n=1 Tax=Gossypium arboreum TaxID=29729 RepID=A0A0B0N535_GOSAR|nr:hypothetical protein F383_36740 [Gossypium arboreum]
MSGTLALYEIFELSAYHYDSERFNGHSEKRMIICDVYLIQVRSKCILC